jgi:ParB-like chromosome segregation protein Spo0J
MSRYELSPAQLEDARRQAAEAFGLTDEQAATLEGRTRMDVEQAALKLAREDDSVDPAILARRYGRRQY